MVSRTSYYEIRHQRIFFLQVVSRKKEEKSSTDELPTTRVAVEFFLSYESLKSRKRRIFLPTSYIQGQLKYGKPRKPLSPPGLVCRHKGGTRERKERREKDQGRWSVATRRGREKNKKRKEKKKTKVGEKVAPAKARFCLQVADSANYRGVQWSGFTWHASSQYGFTPTVR